MLRKLSKRDDTASRVLEEIREIAKSDENIIAKFKEYGLPLSDIDKVDISFVELDTSARTKDRKIMLNELMLEPGYGIDPAEYLVHELVHYLQQSTGYDLASEANDDYLDKESELEAFDVQIDYKRESEGDDAAEEYVEDLVEHHELPISSRDGKEKAEELLGG